MPDRCRRIHILVCSWLGPQPEAAGPYPGSRRPQSAHVNAQLRVLLDTSDAVVTRRQLREVLPRHAIDYAVRSRAIVPVFPQTFVEPQLRSTPEVRQLAALRYAGGRAALSHLSGLALWGLVAWTGVVHIVVGSSVRVRGTGELIVHRRAGFVPQPPFAVIRNGQSVVRLERCLVDSWPMLPSDQRRAAVILAVQQRATTPQRVLDVVRRVPNLPRRTELEHLVELLAVGCMSELEIWGHLQVFGHSSLPAAARQLPLQLGGRRVYLDIAYVEEMVNVELDGSRYHYQPHQREHDMRRDAALAPLGWLVLRFSHQRLHDEPAEVRRELLATLAARRRQLDAA